MTPTDIKIRPYSTVSRYGIAYVADKQGNLLRQVPLTADEYATLCQGKKPAPVTDDEWKNFAVTGAGFSLDPGEGEIMPEDGSLLIKLHNDETKPAPTLHLYPEEWSKDASDVVSISDAAVPYLIVQK